MQHRESVDWDITSPADQCPQCHQYAIIVTAVNPDTMNWQLECTKCGTPYETGTLTK